MTVPSGNRVADVLLSGTQKLTVDDRSTLGESGELTKVASVGPHVSEFGAGVDVYADVISEGDVDFLRSQSHVYGGLTTEGSILTQDNVVIDGSVNTNTPVSSAVTTWSVDWPEDLASNITLAPDAPNTELRAGAYDQLVA